MTMMCREYALPFGYTVSFRFDRASGLAAEWTPAQPEIRAAKQHPVIAAYMQTAAIDFDMAIIARALEMLSNRSRQRRRPLEMTTSLLASEACSVQKGTSRAVFGLQRGRRRTESS